jgi:hypothetical protein
MPAAIISSGRFWLSHVDELDAESGAGLIVAINAGYDGFFKRDEAKINAAAAEAQQRDQLLDRSATGSSRITNDTARIGGVLYRYGSLPFEIASVLLLVAIVGSVMLARTLKQEAAVDDVDPEVLRKEAVVDPELAEVQTETAA